MALDRRWCNGAALDFSPEAGISLRLDASLLLPFSVVAGGGGGGGRGGGGVTGRTGGLETGASSAERVGRW